ncbi:MAG TPA: DUF1802 family protein [Gemmatimonadaceae bacterium]|nr:DUF1802 family protein [Gemmatimonadaceae bacterium]
MADESPPLERTALKEWAVLVDAMSRGEIIATVRKGGIREQRAGFAVRHDQFLLYPTFFHEKVGELDERFRARAGTVAPPHPGTIALGYLARVAGVWSVSDLETLRAIQPMQGLDWNAIESRFHYKGKPGVQVVALRLARLPGVVVIPEARRYAGCVSWVELDGEIDVAGARAVLTDQEFAAQLGRLELLLA